MLRIVCARHLDNLAVSITPETNTGTGTVASIDAAAAALRFYASQAPLRVFEEKDIAGYLVRSASDLQASALEWTTKATPEAAQRINAAIANLAGSGREPTPGPYDFSELVSLIEGATAMLYADAGALPTGAPPIQYDTRVTELPSWFEPFSVTAKADIEALPRTVTIIVANADLRATDLACVAYSMFHELVCHGFQAVGKHPPPSNAPSSCHWTEAWMDTLAYAVACRWTELPNSWLPIAGEDARDAMSQLHGVRYADSATATGSRLDVNTAISRRATRQAVGRLKRAFLDGGLAVSQDDAEMLVANFSFIANAHPAADHELLRRISRCLAVALAGNRRPSDALLVAVACLDFITHRQLAQLEEALLGVLQGRT